MKLAGAALLIVVIDAVVFAAAYYSGCLPGKHRKSKRGKKQ